MTTLTHIRISPSLAYGVVLLELIILVVIAL